jgi:hypothetical protein
MSSVRERYDEAFGGRTTRLTQKMNIRIQAMDRVEWVRIQKVTNPALASNTNEAGADAGSTGLLAVARFGKRFWPRSAHVVKFRAIAVGQIRCGHEAPQ